MEDINSLRSHDVDNFSITFTDDQSTTDIGLISRLISPMVSSSQSDLLLAVSTFDEVH